MANWSLRRKNTQENVPEEVKEYYQAERRERVGVAWLLALVTLAVTILLAAALFFGGRWVYRSLFVDDNDTDSSQVEQDVQETGSDTDTSSEATEPTDEDSDVEVPADEDALTEPDSTPTTGPSTDELPSTGPSSNE